MEEIIRQLTIPAIFSIIIIIIIYCLNMANEYIVKPIGITKYGKKYAIIIFLIIIGISIICILITAMLYNSKHFQNNIISRFGYKIYFVYMISTIIFGVLWIKISFKFDENKNILKFINMGKNKSKFYKAYPVLVLTALLIIDNILLCVSFYCNDKNIYTMAIMVYIYNMICSIIIFGFMNAKLQLSSLKNVTIELKNNRYFSNSKIIYQNDKYTCICYNQRIIRISTSEILLIEEEKYNKKNKSYKNSFYRKIIKKRSDIKLFRWIKTRLIKIITMIAGLIIMIFLIIKATNHVSYDGLYGFLGGVIGGISTLVAIYLTLRSEVNERRETKRMEVKPYLISELTNETSLDEKYCMPSGYMVFNISSTNTNYRKGIHFVNFINDDEKNIIVKCAQNVGIPFLKPNVIKITNIGLGPCLEVKTNIYKKAEKNYELIINNVTPFFNLISGNFMKIAIVLSNYQYGTYKVDFTIKDIYKNTYNQYFKFAYEKSKDVKGHSQDQFSLYPITIPKLDK